MKQKLLAGLAAGVLFAFGCSYDGNDPVRGFDENSSAPSVTQQTSDLAGQSTYAPVEENAASVASEQQEGLPGTDEGSGGMSSCANKCLEDFSGWSALQSVAMLQPGSQTTENCKNVTVKSSEGATIFRARLRDDCEVQIEYHGNGFEIDTSFYIQ
jgi:hypothetical protein